MDKKITALKVQKRNPNRVNLYLDGEFAFGLARVVAAWLQVGQTLSESKITELRQQDSYEVALQKALQFLSYRSRTQSEVQQRLEKQGFDEEVITKTLERLKENNLLGDEQFARTWLENRSAFRPRSRRLLAMELRQKGVENDIIDEAIEDTEEDDVMAYHAALRYMHRIQQLDKETFYHRLSTHLMRRGFSYQISQSVAKRAWLNLQTNNHERGEQPGSVKENSHAGFAHTTDKGINNESIDE